ncbi:hypothetical protein Pelo_6186 [Pelomyxa schiedti]|nr:hypothetical protein Pelo_6186 [Pelomyxa schiedti]
MHATDKERSMDVSAEVGVSKSGAVAVSSDQSISIRDGSLKPTASWSVLISKIRANVMVTSSELMHSKAKCGEAETLLNDLVQQSRTAITECTETSPSNLLPSSSGPRSEKQADKSQQDLVVCLQQERDMLKSELKTTNALIASQTKEIEELKVRHIDTIMTKKKIESQLALVGEKLLKMEGLVEVFQKNYSTVTSHITTLTRAYSDHKQLVGKLKKKHNNILKHLDIQNKLCCKLQSDIVEEHKMCNQARNELNELLSKMEETTRNHSRLATQLQQDLLSKYQREKVSSAKYAERLSALEQEADSLRQQNSTLKLQYDECEKLLKEKNQYELGKATTSSLAWQPDCHEKLVGCQQSSKLQLVEIPIEPHPAVPLPSDADFKDACSKEITTPTTAPPANNWQITNLDPSVQVPNANDQQGIVDNPPTTQHTTSDGPTKTPITTSPACTPQMAVDSPTQNNPLSSTQDEAQTVL